MSSVIAVIVVTIVISVFYIAYLRKKKQYKELTLSLILLVIGAWLYICMLMKWPVPNPLVWIELAMAPLVKLLVNWTGA